MATTQGSTTPFWTHSADVPRFATLAADIATDVVVVGAGVTGVTAAYLLAQAGKRVVVLERERCGSADTGHTSAHLTMVTDSRLTDLVKLFGRDHAQAVWDAGLAAIATIDGIIRGHEIDAGFAWVDGYLHAPRANGSGKESLRLQQDAALASELGFDAEYIEADPLTHQPAVRFADQARLQPRRYLAGVVEACAAAGVKIYEHSPADEFSDAPRAVKVGRHTVRCEDVVVATHNPLIALAGFASAAAFQTKLALYTSYVVAGRVPRGAVPDALWWDTGDPYDYLRVEPHHDHSIVVFGGEDHKTGQHDDTTGCYRRLEERLTAMLPGVEVTHRWSGQVIETPDGLPYIGRVADHQYVATGYAGNGLTFGTLAAMMLSDAILARANPWRDLLEPSRTALRRGAWNYLRENVDYPYYLIRDRFAGAEGKSVRTVKRGEGKVIERNGTTVAAYRDASGSVTLRSAICSHMGCVVTWNAADETWDCPCHGSRFKPSGDVISGPAQAPLSTVE